MAQRMLELPRQISDTFQLDQSTFLIVTKHGDDNLTLSIKKKGMTKPKELVINNLCAIRRLVNIFNGHVSNLLQELSTDSRPFIPDFGTKQQPQTSES